MKTNLIIGLIILFALGAVMGVMGNKWLLGHRMHKGHPPGMPGKYHEQGPGMRPEMKERKDPPPEEHGRPFPPCEDRIGPPPPCNGSEFENKKIPDQKSNAAAESKTEDNSSSPQGEK